MESKHSLPVSEQPALPEEEEEAVGQWSRGVSGDSRVVRNTLMGVAGDATEGCGEVLACAATESHIWLVSL